MCYYIWYSIKRRKTANFIIIGISIMLAVLLNVYFGNISGYRNQLAELSQNVPVYCQITSRNGNLGNGLFISEKTVDSLLRSGAVTEESCMVVLMAGEGDFLQAEYAAHLNLYVVGANRPEAVGELTYDMIHMDKDETDGFFASDRPECIVSEKTLKKHGWEIGDVIPLNFYYYGAESEFTKLELHPMGRVAEVKIAGSMEDLLGKTNAAGADIIMPFEAVRNVYHQADVPFFADMFTFHVKNPLELNAFKEEMREIGLQETAPEAADSYTGCALGVRDSSFIASATDLRHSIEWLQAFFPMVCLLVFLIGYVVSFLFCGSRKEEYMLLRLHGVGKARGSLLFLAEQMFLVLIGSILGSMLMAVFSMDFRTMAIVSGVLIPAYLVGAASAGMRINLH